MFSIKWLKADGSKGWLSGHDGVHIWATRRQAQAIADGFAKAVNDAIAYRVVKVVA